MDAVRVRGRAPLHSRGGGPAPGHPDGRRGEGGGQRDRQHPDPQPAALPVARPDPRCGPGRHVPGPAPPALPTPPGVWTVLLVVRSANDTAQNTDYDFTDNARVRQFNVSSQPDLTIALRGPSPPIFMGSPFVVNVNVTNLGGTPATGIVVAVNWSGDPLVAPGHNAGP